VPPALVGRSAGYDRPRPRNSPPADLSLVAESSYPSQAPGTLRRVHTPCDVERKRAALAARARVPGLPVLVLSQHVETLYARELLADRSGGVGYLLKESVFDADQFLDAVDRVAAGGTALDPAVVARLLGPTRPPGRWTGSPTASGPSSR
jgi:hypothetical protein